MILHHKDLKIKENLLRLKKQFNYSKDLSFIPILYDKKELLIQSPHMFIPFEIKNYSENFKKKYLDLTFQNNSDKETLNFIENLNIIFKKVKDVYINYTINEFIKETDIYKWMRFKIDDDTLFFNQYKEKINSFSNKSFGVFIFSLNGLWLMKGKIWFNWKILQCKIHIPTKLKEYLFIDEDIESDNLSNKPIIQKKIPPPPINKNKNSIKDQISKNKLIPKKNIKNNSFTPSIDEIMLALKTLNKV